MKNENEIAEFFPLFFPLFCNRREVIRQAREARRQVQNRWDELVIAEKYDFTTVERYKLNKATGKEKALASAVEKGRTAVARRFNGGYRRGGFGGRGGYHYTNYNQGHSSGNYSDNGGGNGGGNDGGFGGQQHGGGRGRGQAGGRGFFGRGGQGRGGFSGNCNNCGRKGHMWRDCPERQ